MEFSQKNIWDLPAVAHFYAAFFCSLVDLLLLLELAAIWKNGGKSMCSFQLRYYTEVIQL